MVEIGDKVIGIRNDGNLWTAGRIFTVRGSWWRSCSSCGSDETVLVQEESGIYVCLGCYARPMKGGVLELLDTAVKIREARERR